jgi:hypothetical protein
VSISNLVSGYFIQREGLAGWEDVPAHVMEHAGHRPNPYFDINQAQAALDAAEAFGEEKHRLIVRPVPINQE